MGSLNLPSSGSTYLDTNSLIYTVERHPLYFPILSPLWDAVAKGTQKVVGSELLIVETLVGPFRTEDVQQTSTYEDVLYGSDMQLLPITRDILLEAARLRAAIPGLKTPDAIHAATAIVLNCTLFVSNDAGFRRIPNLPLVLLDDVLATI